MGTQISPARDPTAPDRGSAGQGLSDGAAARFRTDDLITWGDRRHASVRR